ncbi:hypothetical protein B0H16DRAFT_1419388 [Mycena metata]|uniref:Transmembrane protein n=1 Tax=Mycena metata TaxID=1033252 RepID=A0AAD7IVU4_9AGAR|nr:hypothetical protein B0H16DRAFT_1419388 [Mycena metata]
MVFWILLILLTRELHLTYGHPVHISRGTTDDSELCDSTINNCRTLFDIVWGCLATIFACTWVALHQNVPDRNRSWLSLLLRKLMMMLVTIIAPEMVVALACRQLISALRISKKFNISRTHGFFCTMGGFVAQEGYPIARLKQLPAYISAIRNVEEEDITDRSKGDALSKGVALAQGLWFITQCMARVSQHLPVTELEVATLAFAAISILIRSLWWWKPLDVQRPIAVARAYGTLDPPDQVSEASQTGVPLWKHLDNMVSATYGQYPNYHVIPSTSVPAFWTMEIRALDTHKFWHSGFITTTTLLCTGAIFGSIHCMAWGSIFPSGAEMWIWRIASVYIVAFPSLIGCTAACSILFRLKADSWVWQILLVFSWITCPIYIVCRLVLVVLSFTTLRALSSADFVDVSWSKYIPHF